MGPTPYDGPQTIFSATPATRREPEQPALGEDTERGLLGLAPAEIAEYAAAGALS